jgi:hypothetical protein
MSDSNSIPPITGGGGYGRMEPSVALPNLMQTIPQVSATFIPPSGNPFISPVSFGGGFGGGYGGGMYGMQPGYMGGFGMNPAMMYNGNFMPQIVNRFELDQERHHFYAHGAAMEGRDTGRTLGTLGGAATGAALGAALFSWTGPGALLAAGVGGIVGAVAGFFGGGAAGQSVGEFNAIRRDSADNGRLDGSAARAHV